MQSHGPSTKSILWFQASSMVSIILRPANCAWREALHFAQQASCWHGWPSSGTTRQASCNILVLPASGRVGITRLLDCFGDVGCAPPRQVRRSHSGRRHRSVVQHQKQPRPKVNRDQQTFALWTLTSPSIAVVAGSCKLGDVSSFRRHTFHAHRQRQQVETDKGMFWRAVASFDRNSDGGRVSGAVAATILG